MGRILVSAVFGWDPIFVTFRTGEHIGETLLLGKGDGDSVRKTSGESPWVNKSQEAGTPTCYNVKNYILEHNFRTLKTCLLHFCHQPELFRKKEGCDIVIPFLFLSLFWLITALRYHFHYDPSPSTSDHQHQDWGSVVSGGSHVFFFFPDRLKRGSAHRHVVPTLSVQVQHSVVDEVITLPETNMFALENCWKLEDNP